MDYISGKVTVLVGEASSRVNDTRRKWQQQREHKRRGRRQETNLDTMQTTTTGPAAHEEAESFRMVHGDDAIADSRQRQAISASSGPHHPGAHFSSPLAGGIPFGGDTFTQTSPINRRPPPIGFRLDPIETSNTSATTNQPGTTSRLTDRPLVSDGHSIEQQKSRLNDSNLVGESDESLYKGDAWARLWFQRVMILSLLRLLLFIRKVYEDFQATKVYNLTGQTGHFLIAATTLLLPTVVFTIYRVSRYLQITLPPLRVIRARQQPYPTDNRDNQIDDKTTPSATDATAGVKTRGKSATSRYGKGASEADEAQLTRALMSSPVQSTTDSIERAAAAADDDREAAPSPMAAASAPLDDNEGLVTARQTPTNADEFHDSKSQQDTSQELEAPPAAPASGRAADEVVPRAPSRNSRLNAGSPTAAAAAAGNQLEGSPQPLESVKIERLLPAATADRETTRVVTGASEQLLHGVLFIFWQLKRQVDVMGYLVERACLWRKPAEREKDQLGRLRTGSDGLEWFQDFYAAFLAILAQVYTLGLHWSGDEHLAERLSASQVSAATSGLASSPDAAGAGGDLGVSNSARAVSNLLSSQALAGKTLGGKDVLIMSELIVSTAVVLSLLIAVRRRDDGPLTLGLSMLGWGSLFSARIIVIALSFVHIGWHLMLPVVVLHVLLITGWIYSIAMASHNDRPSERQDEAAWDEETAVQVKDQLELEEVQANAAIHDSGESIEQAKPTETEFTAAQQAQSPSQTSQWSIMEHIVLLAQILSLFAIPSLFYWPIMFNLKLHYRPFKYLVLILFENFFLITAIWFTISSGQTTTPGQLYLLGFVGGFSILGFIFISLYIACKPGLTEYFARADELFNEAEKSGIYYEFCSRVFKMPDLSKQTFRRLMNQSEVVVEEVVEIVDE